MRKNVSRKHPLDPEYPAFSQKLRTWFKRSGRDLPWRRTRDPYRILISELMLQQTQVSRVVERYQQFLAQFPTLGHIADTSSSVVVEAWDGLGYYNRARNLHKLARELFDNETRDPSEIGVLPDRPEELRRLPGIGAYTAGAVASFAYEKRAALVDTNVARVLKRVFAPTVDHKSSAGSKIIWQIAQEALPRTGKTSWTHNQAVMELGALVCTARVMHCTRCPVRALCATHSAHSLEPPVRKPAKKAAKKTAKKPSPKAKSRRP